MIEIYGLYDPITGELRYIGKATNSQKRLKSHMRDAKRRKTPVYCWINSLTPHGFIPECKVLQTCTEADWPKVETAIIKQYRDAGHNLLNVANGGDEPFCATHVRQTNGATVARLIHDDPRRKKIWQLKTKIGLNIRTLQRLGHVDAATRLRNKLATLPI